MAKHIFTADVVETKWVEAPTVMRDIFNLFGHSHARLAELHVERLKHPDKLVEKEVKTTELRKVCVVNKIGDTQKVQEGDTVELKGKQVKVSSINYNASKDTYTYDTDLRVEKYPSKTEEEEKQEKDEAIEKFKRITLERLELLVANIRYESPPSMEKAQAEKGMSKFNEYESIDELDDGDELRVGNSFVVKATNVFAHPMERKFDAMITQQTRKTVTFTMVERTGGITRYDTKPIKLKISYFGSVQGMFQSYLKGANLEFKLIEDGTL